MESREDRNKRYLATAMSFLYFVLQSINLFVCAQQYWAEKKIGYTICIVIILIVDKTISFMVLKREKFGFEILLLDMLNMGFISIALRRYPPTYRPMYGAKVFFVIIPTVAMQLLFFFGLDMIDQTKSMKIQVLMLLSYGGYQLLQIRCLLALRVQHSQDLSDFFQTVTIYTLNIFSNYGMWLVFASHRDEIFDISLIAYGVMLFVIMIAYQSYKLFQLKMKSTLLLNFLYNIITSTNYTTDYKYYFHHYSTHFQELYQERKNDLLVMSIYKSLQLAIYFSIGNVQNFKDQYFMLDMTCNFMLFITALDIISNIIQFLFGVRTSFYSLNTQKIFSISSIANTILNIPSTKKYIYIHNSIVYTPLFFDHFSKYNFYNLKN